MKVNVIIPTLGLRKTRLLNCIESIRQGNYDDVNIFIVLSKNKVAFNWLLNKEVALIFDLEASGYLKALNYGMRFAGGDSILYASDELIFDTNCIQEAVTIMKECFSDTDGIVSLTWHGSTSSEDCCFALVGKKFIERFPGRRIFCPDYHHYAGDSEFGRFAKSIGKCRKCKSAILDHPRLRDKTFEVANSWHRGDRNTIKERRKLNFLWGKDFNLIRQ